VPRGGKPPPNARKVARALTLHRADMTLAQIGQELGVSAETARQYVMLAKNAERWLPTYNRAEIAANATGILLQLQTRGMARLDEDGAEYEKVVPAIVSVLRLLVEIHGAKAPTRIDITTEEPHPDPKIIEAVRAEGDAIAAADRAEIERGS
jgi:predicted transcriptional regulator